MKEGILFNPIEPLKSLPPTLVSTEEYSSIPQKEQLLQKADVIETLRTDTLNLCQQILAQMNES